MSIELAAGEVATDRLSAVELAVLPFAHEAAAGVKEFVLSDGQSDGLTVGLGFGVNDPMSVWSRQVISEKPFGNVKCS